MAAGLRAAARAADQASHCDLASRYICRRIAVMDGWSPAATLNYALVAEST